MSIRDNTNGNEMSNAWNLHTELDQKRRNKNTKVKDAIYGPGR